MRGQCKAAENDKDKRCWLEDRWWGHEGRWCALQATCWLNVEKPWLDDKWDQP